MSRLAPLDKILVPILVALWVVVFGLGVRTLVMGGPSFFILELSVGDTGSYPVLTGDFFGPWAPYEQADLRPGDRLIRVGDADLRAVGTVGFLARTLDEAEWDLSVPLLLERDGERLETTLVLPPGTFQHSPMAASLTLVASALFLLLRGRPTPTVRAWFYFAVTWALAPFFSGGAWEFYFYVGVIVVLNSVLFGLVFRFAFLFPDDRAPEGRWHRIWPWVLSLAQGLASAVLFFLGGPLSIVMRVFFAIMCFNSIALLAVVTGKYRGADSVARRQMKWVLFGTYCVVLLVGGTGAATAFDARLFPLFLASFWAVPLIPLALVISVVRFNLFDIDRLLSAAASYNVLLVILGAGALVGVPRLAEAASGVVGVDPGTGQVLLSLALAALVVPAHRRLRPQIDRVFFKERYALDRGIAELLPTLSACTNTRELTERAGAGLHAVLRPEACVVYARVGESYVPVFVEGRAVPPAFAAGSSLIVALREHRGPLSLDDAGRRPDEAPLGPFDRAALETLRAEVVVPVRQGDALAAFLCLGPKRSGDVYTSTDRSLLAAVAEKVSTELRRFDQQEVTREAQAMQESLRRYVPGAVAEQLSSGAELVSGTLEVSVLFVDLRGYTGFAESRRAEEIFATVNRYTETVSQIVQKLGGSVVEFNGDGMMAVFGTPGELPHKERAAVEAGYEIVDAVGALPVDDGRSREEKLSVGVGIATGEAFVGNIRAVDRMIWSVIGNTTNLAARLQSLTRELDAALVIDRATWERAQPTAAGFEKRPDQPIRGRRETQDVYVLPLRSDSQ
ncbi:MAG: adenylate/guanylate cyclase domain-containing protein [Myxococcota bacterium]